jgi:hypothetical protein
MNHKLFGKLKRSEGRWIGKAKLPAFQKAAPDASGAIPIHVHDPEEEGPTAHQEAAFQYLVAKADAFFPAVDREVFKSFQHAYADKDWREMCGLTRAKSPADLEGEYTILWIEIYREHHQGASFLGFRLEAAWEDDSGLMVICHADKPARWTTCDGVYEDELIASDEPVGDEKSQVPSPSSKLVDAVFEGDDATAKKLIAAGMDINALAPDEYPPLWIAVSHVQVDLVRRLLEYGADPGLKHPLDKNTPLRLAKFLYREMGFSPTKKKEMPIGAIIKNAGAAAAYQMQKAQSDLEEIMQLLEAAENNRPAGKGKKA